MARGLLAGIDDDGASLGTPTSSPLTTTEGATISFAAFVVIAVSVAIFVCGACAWHLRGMRRARVKAMATRAAVASSLEAFAREARERAHEKWRDACAGMTLPCGKVVVGVRDDIEDGDAQTEAHDEEGECPEGECLDVAVDATRSER
jgi:hypothetical protein